MVATGGGQTFSLQKDIWVRSKHVFHKDLFDISKHGETWRSQHIIYSIYIHMNYTHLHQSLSLSIYIHIFFLSLFRHGSESLQLSTLHFGSHAAGTDLCGKAPVKGAGESWSRHGSESRGKRRQEHQTCKPTEKVTVGVLSFPMVVSEFPYHGDQDATPIV